MANANNTNVTIIPGKASSLATALRGHINAVLAYMRVGEPELTEEAIAAMRRDLTMFETEVRLNIKEA
jgi:hypothetical protein